MPTISRRTALKALGAVAAIGSISPLPLLTRQRKTQMPRATGTALRIAHLTDVHVSPGNASRRGLAACLRHVHSLPDAPDLILNGGDAIGDASRASAEETRGQWELWQRVMREECRLPIEHCLGNHDIWGGDRAKGKQWALDSLGLAHRYRSFDRAGWHFIVLDSVTLTDDDYVARLDDEQFDWLRRDLRATDGETPVLILSHIPILAACPLFDGDNEKTGRWELPAGWMHVDARRLKDLFAKHANVKLCLSGHIHLRDRVEYAGVTYLCNGAVSGNWWDGAYQDCEPGYALLDLHADGTFTHQYTTYA